MITMKLKIVTLTVAFACWAAVTNAQEVTTGAPGQCRFGDLPTPMIVPDLPDVCSDIREREQCCARDYILARLNTTQEEFLDALRAELRERFDLFRGLARRTREFLDNNNFLEGLFRSFADVGYLQRRSALVSEFIAELREHFDIDRIRDVADNFNVTGLLRRYIDRIKEEVVQEYAGQLGSRVQECLRNLIQERVDEEKLEAFAAAIEQIRRVRTSLARLADFLDNLNTTLLGFRPLRQCVNRLVEAADCDSCLTLRPPICRNWCGALARACYSPFYQVLNQQFEKFWMIAREIFDDLPLLWARLNLSRRIIRLGSLTFAADVLRECTLDLSANDFLSGLFGKRQADNDRDNTPEIPTMDIDDEGLRGGAFQYDRSGGPRLCRLFSIRTRARDCWDGNEERTTDISAFMTDTINGQDQNPAIQIDTAALQAQASALGSPVDTFVGSAEFTDTMPSGSGGSPGLAVTFTLLVTGLLAALWAN